jgi:voltage-gated sodium channel
VIEHEAAEEAVHTMTKAQRDRRREYMVMTLEDLQQVCDEQGIKYDALADRRDLTRLIEEKDTQITKPWVRGKAFEGFWLIMILINALYVAVQIDHAHLLSAETWAILNFTWFLVFLTEAIIKASVMGWRSYIADPWHVFDVVVLTTIALQMSATYSILIGESRLYKGLSQYVATDFVQVVRLCRLFRLASYFKELGMLIHSFIGSIKALSWIMVLLFIWFYIAACVATIFVGRRDNLPSEDEADIKDLREKFATIPLSMFALFEVMTLEGWVDYVRPLLKTRVHLVFFFLAFIFITAFFMLNLITAVVVDRTVAAQQSADDVISQEQFLTRKARIKFIAEMLLRSNPTPGDDTIALSDFERALDNPEVQEVMRELGFSKRYMMSMFGLSDHDSAGEASISGIRKLLEVGHEALDTTNYVRFQVNFSHRLDFQENLVLSVLDGLEKMGDGKIILPKDVKERIKTGSMLQAHPHQGA